MNLDTLKEVLPLAEKYGLAYVMVFFFMAMCIYVVRYIITDARKDKEEAQEDVKILTARLEKITDKMDGEREKFMEPLVGMVNKLKKDSGEDRGG
ncbi:hypothetical protein [Paenibacillus illinoisensis]|uniref:hypothetical protein n=1 Tax=Paenibacillus illinoisensis TaxID=59845 RepID=UPI00301B74FF